MRKLKAAGMTFAALACAAVVVGCLMSWVRFSSETVSGPGQLAMDILGFSLRKISVAALAVCAAIMYWYSYSTSIRRYSLLGLLLSGGAVLVMVISRVGPEFLDSGIEYAPGFILCFAGSLVMLLLSILAHLLSWRKGF